MLARPGQVPRTLHPDVGDAREEMQRECDGVHRCPRGRRGGGGADRVRRRAGSCRAWSVQHCHPGRVEPESDIRAARRARVREPHPVGQDPRLLHRRALRAARITTTATTSSPTTSCSPRSPSRKATSIGSRRSFPPPPRRRTTKNSSGWCSGSSRDSTSSCWEWERTRTLPRSSPTPQRCGRQAGWQSRTTFPTRLASPDSHAASAQQCARGRDTGLGSGQGRCCSRGAAGRTRHRCTPRPGDPANRRPPRVDH